MLNQVDQVCRTSYEDMDPDEVDDYDPTETAEYQDGYEAGQAEERAKWLPLFEAVKELERLDDFSRDNPNRYDVSGFGNGVKLPKFKELTPFEQHQIRLARREIHRVLLTLRSRGEK